MKINNFTQELSKKIILSINKKKRYTDNQKVVIIYGTGLFLNSFLKTLTYLVIGVIFHKGLETTGSIFLFMGLRCLSGGKHAKTEMGCFFLSGIIIAVSVGGACFWQMSMRQYWGNVCALNILYAIFSENKRCFGKSNIKNLIGLLVILNIIFIFGALINSYWRALIVITTVEQGMTLVGDGLDERKEIRKMGKICYLFSRKKCREEHSNLDV